MSLNSCLWQSSRPHIHSSIGSASESVRSTTSIRAIVVGILLSGPTSSLQMHSYQITRIISVSSSCSHPSLRDFHFAHLTLLRPLPSGQPPRSAYAPSSSASYPRAQLQQQYPRSFAFSFSSVTHHHPSSPQRGPGLPAPLRRSGCSDSRTRASCAGRPGGRGRVEIAGVRRRRWRARRPRGRGRGLLG